MTATVPAMRPLTAEGVVSLAAQAREHGRLGIDTEFMGEGRYRTLLCLVQIAVPDPDAGPDAVRVEVFDPLEGDVDPGPLAEVLADPTIEIVMHAARQDVALLRRVWETEITNLFDTQVAAGFAGLRAQAGYETLLGELLSIRVGKSASYTKWDKRPLSDEQVAYAREDVVHLLQMADALTDRLRASGRLDWALEECRPLQTVSDVREIDTVFDRLPRINGLDAKARAVARELVAWRDETARTQDRTVQSVLADAVLVEIAKRKPDSPAALENIRGLNPGNLRRRGADIVEVVARGRTREPIAYEGERGPRPHRDDPPLLALGEALVRARAMQEDLAYELIASRADLQAVVTAVRAGLDDADARPLHGWRRELIGDELIALLRGESRLSVGHGFSVTVEAPS